MITPIGTEVFRGFNIKLPEYEVITPQRKQSFTVRSLNVSEEQALKGSILTPSTISEHLAKVLWDCIVKKPEDIKTYDDFINNVTLRDRDTLLYGLYIATYKDTMNFEVPCQECDRSNKVKINMEEGFNFNVWPNEEDCLTYRKEVKFRVIDGVSCFLKVPVIKDEIEIAKKTLSMSPSETALATDLLMIDRFEIAPTKENPEVEVIKERNNIMKAYSQLPPIDRRSITKEYRETFDQYHITVKTTVPCRCGSKSEHIIDVTRQFFLAVVE